MSYILRTQENTLSKFWIAIGMSLLAFPMIYTAFFYIPSPKEYVNQMLWNYIGIFLIALSTKTNKFTTRICLVAFFFYHSPTQLMSIDFFVLCLGYIGVFLTFSQILPEFNFKRKPFIERS